MKIIFSEHKSDYDNYIFPYVVWAFPEPGEQPSMIFDRGFLPASHALERYYLCRHLRVDLASFSPSSENRRIFRKGEGISFRLVSRKDFAYTDARRQFCKQYADARFGQDVMSYDRLDSLFNSRIINHILIFHDEAQDTECGLVAMYLEPPALAYYYFAFYDLAHSLRNLGMFMMTSAVAHFAEKGYRHLYLGTCYSRSALYKTQFRGVAFFNGVRWSEDMKELRYLIDREQEGGREHLLENTAYLDTFYPAGPEELAAENGLRISSSKKIDRG